MAVAVWNEDPGYRGVEAGAAGVLSLIIGLYAVRHVLLTIVALALLLGIFWVANGVIELFTALSGSQASGRGWLVAMGIVSIVAGILLLAIPGLSLVVMVFLIGAWLIFFGVLQTALALRLRSATHSARSWVATPHGAM